MLGAVTDILRARGSEGWLVGGSVRDRLLGIRSIDLDVVVADDAEEIAKRLASILRVPWFSLSERYPTYRVLNSEGHVDLTSVRGADILTDLAERDFTINAMAVPLMVDTADVGAGGSLAGLLDEPHMLDPFDGAEHLREKRLVAVSDRIFADDALRLMRAARFCHTLGLDLEAELLQMIRQKAADLSGAAAERVLNEMCITLAVGRSTDAVRLWDRLGLLGVVLPEVVATGGDSAESVRVKAASGQAWEAKLASLSYLDELLENPEAWFPKEADQLRRRMAEPVDGTVSRPVALRLAGLLGSLGVTEVHAVGRRLKLSTRLDSLLSASARCLGERAGDTVVGDTMTAFRDMPLGEGRVGREVVLFMWRAGAWEPEVVMLGAATIGVPTPDDRARRLMALAVERARGELTAAPVDGEILMRELGLESGPTLGKALREARLAWESGEATSISELVEVARQVVTQE